MLQNQGLLGIAFFEATAFVVLLVLFLLLRRDHNSGFFRVWLVGWICLTLSAASEIAFLVNELPVFRLVALVGHVAAMLAFLGAVMQYTAGSARRNWAAIPLAGATLIGICYFERMTAPHFGWLRWETAGLEAILGLWSGWLLWRFTSRRLGHGARLLAGVFLLMGLHGMDRPQWPGQSLFLLRVAFDHLLAVSLGIAMVVLVLEGGRSRTEELNDKMRRLTLLTAASAQTLKVKDVLDQVLAHLVESLDATHGIVRLVEGEGSAAKLVAKASVGFTQPYLAEHGGIPVSDAWVQEIFQKGFVFQRVHEEPDERERRRMAEAGVSETVTLILPGKEGPLGLLAIGSNRGVPFQPDEISFLGNIANLLGLTLQNVRLFEQVVTVQQQWAYTFDSIGDPILVHDRDFHILRTNQRLNQLLGRQPGALIGRSVTELLPRKEGVYQNCPYCEGMAGEGDDPDPWLTGYFLASNSTFTDPQGRQLGTVHVLKDISERKRAEEKYRSLVSNVQEGVFISTPNGRFLDFNDALMRILGFESREEVMGMDISLSYVNPSDRERLKKLLQEHGSVADFEFDIRRRDGEIRTMTESSVAVRDTNGEVSAFQGFVLDVTERKRAEQEIRRRNRELLVLNSISQTLMESLDLSDSLHRTLRQIAELFALDTTALYVFEKDAMLRRISAVGHRSEYARHFPPVKVQAELLGHIKSLHANFVSAQGLPLPAVFRDAHRREGLVSEFVLILWSKGRVVGGLTVGSRVHREFSPADINLLIAVASQISSAIDRSLLFEETRQAYDNLRRTQEQLLHSEKMAAVGQLISGVAHELNNPLTAILGYSQLLTSSGQVGPQGLEYTEKLYKQAQRTHRIVQNLLSFARQHKPERMPVLLNQVLEDTLALRDYDLRMSNIRVHFELDPDLPITAADPHQLQQVFLNMVNNAVDAILEDSKDGDLWVRTGRHEGTLYVEFTDNGPGVKDATRVFDPFYTTKPVGKGTGLGLSICYGIVTEHGGTIRVRNVQPRGASFRIELPFLAAVAPGSADKAAAPGAAREGRVLLVDPDASVVEAVEGMLRERNHRVSSARTMEEAVALLMEQEFDVVLADLLVRSASDGLSVQDWIADHRPNIVQRLVCMRAAAPLAGESTANENGAPHPNGTRILQKPFEAGELMACVDAVLGALSAPVER